LCVCAAELVFYQRRVTTASLQERSSIVTSEIECLKLDRKIQVFS
ncbi:unnamed protein product, partial [Larinioides sclopetarius]